MNFSLVLATLGRTHELQRFFKSTVAQTHRSFEIIVVDQNVDDRIVPIIEQARGLGLLVEHLRSAPGLSRARNCGLQRASGDIVAFPDDDCWYEPGTLAAVDAALSTRLDHEGLVACWAEQAAMMGADTEGPLNLAQFRRFRGGDASSITLYFRRSLLDRIGAFDERLGLGARFGAAEETDLVLRALAAGATLTRCSSVVVHHHLPAPGAQTVTSDWRKTLTRARGTGAIYAKHRLAAAVIVRGLLAPPVTAIASKQGLQGFKLGLAISAGRLSGLVRWWFEERWRC